MIYLLINPNCKPILYAVIVFVVYCVFMFTDFDEVCKKLWDKVQNKLNMTSKKK